MSLSKPTIRAGYYVTRKGVGTQRSRLGFWESETGQSSWGLVVVGKRIGKDVTLLLEVG